MFNNSDDNSLSHNHSEQIKDKRDHGKKAVSESKKRNFLKVQPKSLFDEKLDTQEVEQ